MQFLKLVRKRSFLSELVYTILNIALAVGVLLAVLYTETIWLALVLVLLSKWRILAVRPRFWWANVQSNVVDLIVSISVVIHMNAIAISQLPETQKIPLLIGFTGLYVGLLLLVKPRSKRSFMVAQAGIALFLGSSAVFMVGYALPVSIIVIIMWLIGYASVRHMLTSYDAETHPLFLSLVGGLTVAELSWVGYHWAVAYHVPGLQALMVPQISIILILVAFLTYKLYDSFYHNARIRPADVLLPLLFTASALVVVLTLFNGIPTAI